MRSRSVFSLPGGRTKEDQLMENKCRETMTRNHIDRIQKHQTNEGYCDALKESGGTFDVPWKLLLELAATENRSKGISSEGRNEDSAE
jgi:hypothetical protein